MDTAANTVRSPQEQRWHRDLWMTYIAQTILGESVSYPIIGGESSDTQDALWSESKSYHVLDKQEANRIKQTAHEYLSGAADQTAVLRRCASEDIEMEHPYYLVLFADQEMKQNNVADDERLARRVCEQMLNTYDGLTPGEDIPEDISEDITRDDMKHLRFSLRRVLIRFCVDSDWFPCSIFLSTIRSNDVRCLIGTGGLTDVYRGVDDTGQAVALKSFRIPNDRDEPNPTYKALKTEAIILSRLKHANILQFKGLFKQQGAKFDLTYIVTPWMAKGDILMCMRASSEQITPYTRIRWIYEMACGLKYLHDEHIVHGDLHTGNILVDEGMHVHIADFGLASVEEPETSSAITIMDHTSSGRWSAPELMEEGAMCSYASDVWAFGCACLLIWTGEMPYRTCSHSLQFLKAMLRAQNPEDPQNTMDSYPKDTSYGREQGASLRNEVALPCWSFDPLRRPPMAAIKKKILEILKVYPDLSTAVDSLAQLKSSSEKSTVVPDIRSSRGLKPTSASVPSSGLPGHHSLIQLNNLLQRTYGTGALRWDAAQHGPQHNTPWMAIAYINGVEYGRGKGWTQGAAKEEASKLAYNALYYQLYGQHPV